MEIIAQCPACNASWLLDEISQDKRIKCKKCGKIFRVPKVEELPNAKNIIRDAKSIIYVDEKGRLFG